MKIAIIILNYNSSADCRKCVSDLKKQSGVEIEIVIVDNCSRSDEREEIEKFCRESCCTFLLSPKNRGYNAGNNIGLRYAAEKKYEYALICNPDMLFPQTDYLEKMLNCINQNENIAVCGSDIQNPEGIHQNPKANPELKWYESFYWVKNIFKRKNNTDIPDWIENPSMSRSCKTLNGCCLLLRLSFLQSIGFFDERTFLYGEEPILARQVEMAGQKAYYTAATYAIHNHRKNREGTSSFCTSHWRHSQLLYARFYSPYPWYGRLFSMFSIIMYFAVLDFYHKIYKND